LSSVSLRLDGVIALHPFLEVIDDGGKAGFAGLVVELFGAGIGHAGQIARRLDHRHLHAQADAQIGDVVLAGVLCGL